MERDDGGSPETPVLRVDVTGLEGVYPERPPVPSRRTRRLLAVMGALALGPEELDVRSSLLSRRTVRWEDVAAIGLRGRRDTRGSAVLPPACGVAQLVL